MQVKTEFTTCKCGKIVKKKYYKGTETSGWYLWYQEQHKCSEVPIGKEDDSTQESCCKDEG